MTSDQSGLNSPCGYGRVDIPRFIYLYLGLSLSLVTHKLWDVGWVHETHKPQLSPPQNEDENSFMGYFQHWTREGNGTPLQYSCLKNPVEEGAWWAAVPGVAKSQTRLSDFTFTFHFHALEKEMANHSSVLAWRIPGMGEPGGLPPMGSHRVGHDWSDLAAATASIEYIQVKRPTTSCSLKGCCWNGQVHEIQYYESDLGQMLL